MYMKNILLFFGSLLLAAFANESWAQERTISGKVTSLEDGGTLPGVNIVLKGTTNGTITDSDGNYTFSVPSEGGTLVFSFIGLVTQEVEVGTRSVIDVALQTDAKELSEVVVVAYGTQTKESIVGSIATVNSEVIEKQQVVSILSAIQGSVPGVNIISSGGQPGDNPTIRIRGIGSINASARPYNNT